MPQEKSPFGSGYLVHSDIENLASTENLDLGALREACKLSLKDVKDVKSALEKKFPIVPGKLPEVDLVLLGSYGAVKKLPKALTLIT